MKTLKKFWPCLLLMILPLWLIGVVSELLDARLLEKEGVPVMGTITEAQWRHSPKSGRTLGINVSWRHAGYGYQGSFSLPSQVGFDFADEEGKLLQPQIEVRYARSKPQLASLAVLPPDPVWVSLIVGSLGFCVITGVVGFFIYLRIQDRKQGR